MRMYNNSQFVMKMNTPSSRMSHTPHKKRNGWERNTHLSKYKCRRFLLIYIKLKGPHERKYCTTWENLIELYKNDLIRSIYSFLEKA